MYIKFCDVSHEYQANTPMKNRVLHRVNFSLEKGSFNCIIGHTGSGKSTLLQHLNALLLPSSGKIFVPGGEMIAGEKPNRNKVRQIRQNVGLVFQFPEHQLFETTVLADIMFGPKNYGKSSDEAEIAARNAAKIVGLDAFLERSPFELSGGQMRLVAIAGVLAMDPDVIVLDEPTSGLDPRSRKMVLSVLDSLQKAGKTIIVATHDMDLVAAHSTHVIVMSAGEKLIEGTPSEIFSQIEMVKKAGIHLPNAASVYGEVFGLQDQLPLTTEAFIRSVGAKKKDVPPCSTYNS